MYVASPFVTSTFTLCPPISNSTLPLSGLLFLSDSFMVMVLVWA